MHTKKSPVIPRANKPRSALPIALLHLLLIVSITAGWHLHVYNQPSNILSPMHHTPLAHHSPIPAAACLMPLKTQQVLLQAAEVLPQNYTSGRYSQTWDSAKVQDTDLASEKWRVKVKTVWTSPTAGAAYCRRASLMVDSNTYWSFQKTSHWTKKRKIEATAK